MTQLPYAAADDTGAAVAGSRRLVLAALALALLVCGLAGTWLWVLRDNRLQFVARQVLLQTSAVGEHASVVFGMVDAALRDSVGDVLEQRIDATDAYRTLQLRMRGGPHVRAINLADAQGRVLASSWSNPPPRFPVAAAPAELDTLRVSAPAHSRFGEHAAIELARAVPGAPGGIAQVVAIVDNQFVASFFARMVIAVDSRVGLFGLDGTPLGGTLDLATLEAGDTSNRDLLDGLLRSSGEGAVQRGRVFAAAQRLEGLPLIVVSARDRDAALAPWRDSVAGVTAGTSAALALLGFMAWRLQRETRARAVAQAALASTRERSRLAFEAAQQGTWAWNLGEPDIELSPRMAELLDVGGGRIARHALLGQRVHPEDRCAVRQALVAHLAGRAPQLSLQFRVATATGGWRWLALRGRAQRNAAGQAQSVVGTAADETESRSRSEQLQELQMQLQRTRRLESLGRLAGGIAHDFNNILAAILGYGELMQQHAAPGTPQARHAEQIVRAGERGRSLVARILAFSRGGSRAHAALTLVPVVNEALDLLAASLRTGVKLERELNAADAVVLGDATQIFEAVSNLCANALHAMPGGGTLRVRVDYVPCNAPRTLSHGTLGVGRHVCISVSDTGVGMDDDVLEHLFEPFFTTRAPQVGTGLGLAMVHGAVKEMHGVIDVRSAPSQGSTFALYFGLLDVDVQVQAEAAQAVPQGAGQVVMVVDDEPALVALAEEALADLGYEPVGFRDPAQALAAMRDEPHRFDAVITDQIMPGMTGTELARALRVLRPDVPMLLATGFGGARLDDQAADLGIAVVLQKPLRRGELAHRLADALLAHAPHRELMLESERTAAAQGEV